MHIHFSNLSDILQNNNRLFRTVFFMKKGDWRHTDICPLSAYAGIAGTNIHKTAFEFIKFRSQTALCVFTSLILKHWCLFMIFLFEVRTLIKQEQFRSSFHLILVHLIQRKSVKSSDRQQKTSRDLTCKTYIIGNKMPCYRLFQCGFNPATAFIIKESI